MKFVLLTVSVVFGFALATESARACFPAPDTVIVDACGRVLDGELCLAMSANNDYIDLDGDYLVAQKSKSKNGKVTIYTALRVDQTRSGLKERQITVVVNQSPIDGARVAVLKANGKEMGKLQLLPRPKARCEK